MSFHFNLLNLFKDLKKNETIGFFTKSETRFFIWLLSLARFNDKTIKNFNYYYKNIPINTSSQININNQIDLGISKKFLTKKKSDFDKRSFIVTSNEQSEKAFEIFLEFLRSIKD